MGSVMVSIDPTRHGVARGSGRIARIAPEANQRSRRYPMSTLPVPVVWRKRPRRLTPESRPPRLAPPLTGILDRRYSPAAGAAASAPRLKSAGMAWEIFVLSAVQSTNLPPVPFSLWHLSQVFLVGIKSP